MAPAPIAIAMISRLCFGSVPSIGSTHAGGIKHGHAARCTTLRESPSCQALDGSAHPDFIQKNVTSNQKYSAQSFADYDQY